MMNPAVGTARVAEPSLLHLTLRYNGPLRPEHGEEESLYPCSHSFVPFAAVCFTKYVSFKVAPLHELMYQNFHDLVTGSTKEATWIAYRNGAKTSIVRIGLFWLIARKQVISVLRHNGKHVSAWGDRLYINVDPYDKANAESIILDVVTKLQANELLIADFGHLNYQPQTNTRTGTYAEAWSRIPTTLSRFRST